MLNLRTERVMTRKPDEPMSTIDFGFSKTVDDQKKQSSLDTAYESWNKKRSNPGMLELLKAAKPVLSKALVSYGGNDKMLMARAKRLAINAFRKYDPTKGTQLRTYLYIQLQPLQREYMKRVAPINIPERVQFDQYKLRRVEEEIRDTKGRDPGDDEVAEKTGLSPKRIAHIRSFAKGLVAEGQILDPSLGGKLPGTANVSAEDIWIEYVHHDLDPIDKQILEWKTGLYGKPTLSTNEIAQRLKVTPGAVSQRASKIAMKIEEGRSGG